MMQLVAGKSQNPQNLLPTLRGLSIARVEVGSEDTLPTVARSTILAATTPLNIGPPRQDQDLTAGLGGPRKQ
jgi:hypothetical protein